MDAEQADDAEETPEMEGDMEGEMEHMKEEHHIMHDMMESPFEMLMKAEKLMKLSSISTYNGSFSYLFVAAFAATHYSLAAFRYYSKSASRDAYLLDSTKTNWFEIGNYIINYGNLSLYGIAFITQLLALFGIAPYINYIVWFWGVMVVGGLANMVGQFLYFLAMDQDAYA